MTCVNKQVISELFKECFVSVESYPQKYYTSQVRSHIFGGRPYFNDAG